VSGGERTLAQALEELAAELAPVPQSEISAAGSAYGRVLAEDVVSTVDLPAFDNSAMDGYALRYDDLRSGHWLHEIGRAYAGHPFDGEVRTGTCVRIMTGAPVPAGADTVVVLEDVVAEAATVRVQAVPPRGANIRRRGEHIRRGAVAIAAGRHLRDADIGLAAGVGASTLVVRRRLRVGVLSTGDELADPPQALAPGGSFDANRPLLHAALERSGFGAHDLGICRDTSQAFAAALVRARQLGLDALITSGGAAQGDADVVRAASAVRFVPLAIRPGRGLAFARIEGDGPALALFGLPGNAVAAYVVFHLLVRPLLIRLAGGRAEVPLHVPLPLAGPVRVRPGRIDYRRASFTRDDAGRLRVAPLRDQGSAMLRTVTDADALIAVGPQESYAEGDPVPAVPLALLD
jgi:molybdopterin molybdotransferase